LDGQLSEFTKVGSELDAGQPYTYGGNSRCRWSRIREPIDGVWE